MRTYIYTLSDPRTGTVRYVGKTVNPKQRRHNHSNIARDKGTHKRNWINQLKQEKLRPLFEIIEEVDSDWKFWEKYWIQQFKVWGFSLTNTTLGGEGLETGNQTSFKKGQLSWNKGTGFVKDCVVCGGCVRTIPSNPKATCSKKCESTYRASRKELNTTRFKPGLPPWNKGSKGVYSTSKKGKKVTSEEIERLRSIALGNTSRRKQVKQYDMNMKLLNTYVSVKIAQETTGAPNIASCARGVIKTSGGYIWRY